MEQQTQKLDLSKYWGVFWRRKLWGLVTTVVLLVIALVVAVQLPDRYETSCVLVVRSEEEDFLDKFVSKGTMKIKSRVERVRVSMTTNESLDLAATRAGLFEDLGARRDDPRAQDMLFRKMRREFKAEPVGEELVRISYKADTAEKAFIVVDEVVGKFRGAVLEKKRNHYNLQLRLARNNTERLGKKLGEERRLFDEFLKQSVASDPEQSHMKAADLRRYEADLLDTERKLDEAKQMRDFYERQMQDLPEFRTRPGQRARENNPMRTKLQDELARVKIQLEDARIRYTDQHSTVKRLEQKLRAIEDLLLKMQQLDEEELKEPNPDFLKFREKHMEQRVAIDTLTQKREDLRQLTDGLRRDLAGVPAVRVQRDKLKQNINDIEGQLTSARKTEEKADSDLRTSQEIHYFEFVNTPVRAKTPDNRRKLQILIAGLVLSLAAGIGAVLGVEYIDQSFTDVNEARDFLLIPALGEIPMIITRGDRVRRWAMRLLTLLIIAGVVAGAAYAYRSYKPVRIAADGFWTDIERLFSQLFT